MFNNNQLKNKQLCKDFLIKDNYDVLNIMDDIDKWANDHYNSRKHMFDEPSFENKNITFENGFKVDINKWDNKLQDPTKWIELIVPTGTVTQPVEGTQFTIPKIDKNDETSYKIQHYLGINWGNHNGFSLDLFNDPQLRTISDVRDQVPVKWEDATKSTDLKREMDDLIKIYSTLNDMQKITADLFAGSGSLNLPPPGQMFIAGSMLSQKYDQDQFDEINMFFALACGFLDSSIAAWWYKEYFRQARPVTLIRHFYNGKTIKSWTPYKGIQDIDGGTWLPYQVSTFNSPPFPDMASGHTVFSTTGGQLLKWWFDTDVLYDGYTIVETPNPTLWSNILPSYQKGCLMGEFIIKKGTTEIEPGLTPQKDTRLVIRTITELYEMCGRSRVYGGIHSESTNKLSGKIGDSVYTSVSNKLKSFNIFPPCMICKKIKQNPL
jgi:hypothetical protein